MSFDHNYRQYYARQDSSRHQESQTAYEAPRPNPTSQYASQSTSGYVHEPYSSHYISSATQGTPQWQSAAYDNRAIDAYATSQSSMRTNQAPHNTSTGSDFLSPGTASLGYSSSAATLENRIPPVQSSNSPKYYQSSHSQYRHAQQQQQQSRVRLADESSGYKQTQYGQTQRRPASATSTPSNGRVNKPGQISAPSQELRQHEQPQTGLTQTPQLSQLARSAFQHAGTASRQSQEDRATSSYQQEAVPANISATRVSAPQDTTHSLATVDPSQVYDPYHEYQRQLARRSEAKRVQQMETARGTDRLPKDKNNTARSADVGVDGEVQETIEPTRNSSISRNTKRVAQKSADKKVAKASNSADDMSAAMTLLQASNATNPNVTQSEKDDLQAQMLEMFRRMREFNKKDPDMLSRLWQQERDQHLAKSTQARPSAAPEASQTTSSPATEEKKKRRPNPGRKPAKNPTEASGSNSSVTSGAGASAPSPAQHKASAPASRFNPVRPRGPPPGTIWPAEKKGILAQAAVDFIKATPGCHMAAVTAADISAILDTNPNYVDLCNAIHQKGFKIDKNTFAKHLLNAFPGSKTIGIPMPRNTGQASSSQTSAPLDPVAEADLRLQSDGHALSTSKSKEGRLPKNATAALTQSDSITPSKRAASRNRGTSPSQIPIDPDLDGLDAVKAFVEEKDRPAYLPPQVKQKVAKKAMRQRNGASTSTTPAPPSKEEAARKRAFGELVDLTHLSESEQESDTLYPPAKRPDQGLVSEAEAEGEAGMQRTDREPVGQSVIDPQNSAPALLKAPWAELGPRATAPPDISALWKWAQPATPQMTAHHVEPKDSTTPMQPRPFAKPSGSTVVIPPGHPIRQAILALPLDKNKALRRSTYDARTIARDVLLASGRHPDMRHLNAHLNHLKEAFPSLGDNNVDLCTINWDVIDPGGPPPGSGTQQQPEFPIDLGHEADGEAEADELGDDDDSGSKVKGSTDFRHHEHRRKKNAEDSASLAGSSMRRGPGRRLAGVDVGGGKPRATATKTMAQPNTASPAGTSGYAALRQFDEHGNLIKKRGRPVGWRKWMQKGGSDAPGKGPNVAEATQPEPEPVYQVYKCEWQNCRAELHNLETLRRHIHKVHGKRADESGQWPCRWSNCGLGEQIVDPSSNRTTSRFRNYSYDDREDWKTHIEAAHLRPIAWKLGDGPAGGLSDRDSELSQAYMSDRQGRRITPQISIPEERAAVAGSAMLRRFKRTAEEEAQQEQANAERKKRDTGPGVDKGGARLANEKRRQGFMDDLSDAQIIDDDE